MRMNSSVLLAAMRARASRRDVLPLDLRRKLHALGLTRLRHSSIMTGMGCDFELLLQCAPEHEAESKTYHLIMVLGIVAHLGAEEAFTGDLFKYGELGDWWIDLYDRWEEQDQPAGIVHRGQGLARSQVRQIVGRFADPLFGTFSFHHVLTSTLMPLVAMGHEVVSIEGHQVYTDGREYPIDITATTDLITRYRGARYVWDLKNYGLLQSFTDGHASIKKVSPSEDSIRLSTQHQHYDWVLQLLGHPPADYYGLLLPANMVPYTKAGNGYRKGDLRGPGQIAVPVPGAAFRQRWERDLLVWLESWVRVQPRRYPRDMGQPRCPSCRFRHVCLQDGTVGSDASNPALDFLRED